MPIIGPFVIFMDNSQLATELHVLTRQVAPKNGFLFAQPEDREKFNVTLRSILTRHKLELRSPRRGGLQRMAMQGASLSTILTFSKHSSIPMLNKYLDHGAVVLAQEVQQVSATNFVWMH